VAVKIIKSKKPFMVQAQTEIKLLELLEANDPKECSQTVRMLHHFVFRNHQCIVFEMLYCNLYELLRNTNFKGISLNLIRKFARQILRTLAFLSRLPEPVIHCDLKPENILLCHPRKSAIKVIDFGSACKITEKMYSYIQSRFYRAPEVLMGLTYDTAIDMWSLGCVLVEMHTGEALFAGKSTHDQMGKIVEVFGLPPKEMINKAPPKQRSQMFEIFSTQSTTVASYRFRPVPPKSKSKSSSDTSSAELGAVAIEPRNRHLHEILGRDDGGPAGRRRGEEGHGPQEYASFINLLEKMLHYDPAQRISADEALDHPFLFNPATRAGSTATAPTAVAMARAAAQAAAPAAAAVGGDGSGGDAMVTDSGSEAGRPASTSS
jgi:dual specificity tyrosine-phosphorylation-regulated kinase 1